MAVKRQKPDSGSELARKRRPKPKQPGAAKKSKGRTRGFLHEVIRLEDRLYYLLQPPLESIAARSCVFRLSLSPISSKVLHFCTRDLQGSLPMKWAGKDDAGHHDDSDATVLE